MFFSNFNTFMRNGLRNLHNQGVFRTTMYSNKLYFISPVNCGLILKETTNCRPFSDSKEKKRVTIIFKKWDGSTIGRRGFVGETIRDLIAIDDPELPGYGCCCGALGCSTCHVILKPEDYERLGDKPSDEEMDLIAYAPDNCSTSRLGCAMELKEEMDGMEVQVPAMAGDQRDEFDR